MPTKSLGFLFFFFFLDKYKAFQIEKNAIVIPKITHSTFKSSEILCSLYSFLLVIASTVIVANKINKLTDNECLSQNF